MFSPPTSSEVRGFLKAFHFKHRRFWKRRMLTCEVFKKQEGLNNLPSVPSLVRRGSEGVVEIYPKTTLTSCIFSSLKIGRIFPSIALPSTSTVFTPLDMLLGLVTSML